MKRFALAALFCAVAPAAHATYSRGGQETLFFDPSQGLEQALYYLYHWDNLNGGGALSSVVLDYSGTITATITDPALQFLPSTQPGNLEVIASLEEYTSYPNDFSHIQDGEFSIPLPEEAFYSPDGYTLEVTYNFSGEYTFPDIQRFESYDDLPATLALSLYVPAFENSEIVSIDPVFSYYFLLTYNTTAPASTSVPEPGSLALLGSGLAGLGLLRLRSKPKDRS